MPIIYFNNFRGFDRTFLNLKDVNFFVGENSTGKTSVLKLIGILSSQDFWRYGEFGRDDINIGSFEEIVTTSSEQRNFFEVGIHDEDFINSSSEFSIKLRYIEHNKLPSLKEVCYVNRSINIQAIVEGKMLKFRYKVANTENVGDIFEFSNWLSDNRLNEYFFERMGLQNIGIIPILTQVNNHILLNQTSDSERKSFSELFQIQLPIFVNKLAWIAPVRAEPLPTYGHGGIVYSPDGRHSPSVLKEIFDPQVRHILNKFGADSGLFEDIITKDLYGIKEPGNPIDKDFNEIRSERFGQSDIFEVRVTINKESRNIVNVGYGVSQVLPIVVEAIAREDNTWFATQQPEVHLHPRAQAALGDFFFKCNIMDGQKFIIETHSDYIIDRFRLRLNRALREGEKMSRMSQLVFFSKKANGNKLEVMEFNDDGSYPDEQPDGLRDFFIKEQLNIITI